MKRITVLAAVLASALVACARGDNDGPVASPFAGSGAMGTASTGHAESSSSSPAPDNDLPPIDWDTDSTTTTGADESGEDSSTGSGAEIVHPCDVDFTRVVPATPTLDPFYVEVSNPVPLVYVGMNMEGPTTVEGSYLDVVESNPWVWRFAFEGHVPGTYVLEFSSAEEPGGPRTTWSTCTLVIETADVP
ncbi:MAG: hypothetical protein ACRBN8_40095 [Nannocystales bacterium]